MGSASSTVAQVAASTTLVAAGVAVAASSGGAAGGLGAALISAGGSDAEKTISKRVAKEECSWKDWRVETAIGFGTGYFCGWVGSVCGAAAQATRYVAAKAVCVLAGSAISAVASTAALAGNKLDTGLRTAAITGSVAGVAACGAIGVVTSAATTAAAWLGATSGSVAATGITSNMRSRSATATPKMVITNGLIANRDHFKLDHAKRAYARNERTGNLNFEPQFKSRQQRPRTLRDATLAPALNLGYGSVKHAAARGTGNQQFQRGQVAQEDLGGVMRRQVDNIQCAA